MPNATTAQSMVTSRDVGLISLRLRLNILRTCGGHQNRIASAANPRFALGQRRDRPQERGRTLAVNPLSGAILSSVRLCDRSEEHTSELQSRLHLVCRLLLEKKKKNPLHSID